MNLTALTNEDYGDIATMFANREKWTQALPFYQELAERMEGNPDARTFLALAWLKTNGISAAETIIGRVLLDYPDHPFANNVKGLVKQELADWAGAEVAAKRAIELMDDNAGFRGTYAHLLQILGRYPEAEYQYDTIIAKDPTNLQSRFFRSLGLMTQGRFAEGCKDYELRYALTTCPIPMNGKPVWRGKEGLAGKTVLLCGTEQGIGDAVMFARYADWLKRLHGVEKVILLVKPEMMQLLRFCIGVDGMVSKWEDAGPYDYHLSAMSCMGLSLSDGRLGLPWYGETPYLVGLPRYDSSLCSPLDSPISASFEKDFKVGFCWSGNPLHGNDRFRSLKREAFDIFLPKPGPGGIMPFNLQHDVQHPKMLNPAIGSVYELAQAIQEMDLVITVDTAIAHISGALGVPTWTLLPSNPDFRWGVDEPATRWYPTMALWRAKGPLEWAPVLEEVQKALKNMVEVHARIEASKV